MTSILQKIKIENAVSLAIVGLYAAMVLIGAWIGYSFGGG